MPSEFLSCLDSFTYLFIYFEKSSVFLLHPKLGNKELLAGSFSSFVGSICHSCNSHSFFLFSFGHQHLYHIKKVKYRNL